MGNQKRAANKGFAFVITDTSGKPSSEDRKLIRSHVMRGKNTRASRLSLGRSAAWVVHGSPEAAQVAGPPASKSFSNGRTAPKRSNACKDAWLEQVYRTPNDLYMFRFADDVDAASRAMIFEFYGVIKETMYPIEWCLNYDVSKTPWFYWLLSDAAFLHSILFTVALLHDSVEGTTSKRTNFHVWKTLKLLNRNIADKDLALADSTIATIVSMCMVSEIFGDRDSTATHIRGMRQVVELRGGIESFQHNLQLKVKICRADIGWSLCTGEKPLYYRNISWEPAFASTLGDSSTGPECGRDLCRIRLFLDPIDRRLSNIFHDLQQFSRLANSLIKTDRKIDPNMFQELMTSVQYRLLYLESTTQDAVTEMFRMGMISYITTLFLKVQGATIRFISLASQLRAICQEFDVSESSAAAVKLIFSWTLVVGAMSVFEDDDDAWLLPKLAGLRDFLGPTWPEAKEKLEEVMWTDNVHSLAGVKVFEKLVLYIAKVPPTGRLQHRGSAKPALQHLGKTLSRGKSQRSFSDVDFSEPPCDTLR